MSATVSAVARPAVARWPAIVSRIGLAAWDAVSGYVVRRSAIATLRELDDRALRDIGIARSQIEAARDLGATPFQAFMRVTLPLSRPALLAGSALVVLPMFGDYYTNDLISASPRTNMLGNEINLFIQGGPQKNLGASLVIVLMVILSIGALYYVFQTARDARRLA